jgi:hypothetical protein
LSDAGKLAPLSPLKIISRKGKSNPNEKREKIIDRTINKI